MAESTFAHHEPARRLAVVRTGAAEVRATAPDALSNLTAVLELAGGGQLRFRAASRRPAAATVRLVEDVLVAGDYYDDEPIAAAAWPLLLVSGGLGRVEGTRLELSPRGRAVLAAPSYPALGTLWQRWLASVSHDELARVEAIRGQHRPGTLTPVPGRRAAVADALAVLDPGEWTSADAVLRSLRTEEPRLVVARSPLTRWRLYISDRRHGSLGRAGALAWDVLGGRYALCVLFEYAATLGLVDVAYAGPDGARDDYRDLPGTAPLTRLSRYDGLVAVRVNALGAAILHDPDTLPALALPVPRR